MSKAVKCAGKDSAKLCAQKLGQSGTAGRTVERVCVVVSVEDAKAVERAGKYSAKPLSAQKLG